MIGLRQVVIGAGVKALDTIVEPASRGQHQDRNGRGIGPQPTAEIESIDAREKDVEDHEVVIGQPHLLERIVAVDGDIHRIRVLAKALRQDVRRSRLVLNDQDSHRRINFRGPSPADPGRSSP